MPFKTHFIFHGNTKLQQGETGETVRKQRDLLSPQWPELGWYEARSQEPPPALPGGPTLWPLSVAFPGALAGSGRTTEQGLGARPSELAVVLRQVVSNLSVPPVLGASTRCPHTHPRAWASWGGVLPRPTPIPGPRARLECGCHAQGGQGNVAMAPCCRLCHHGT